MKKDYFHRSNLGFKDKILSLDFKLIFLILLLELLVFLPCIPPKEEASNITQKIIFIDFLLSL